MRLGHPDVARIVALDIVGHEQRAGARGPQLRSVHWIAEEADLLLGRVVKSGHTANEALPRPVVSAADERHNVIHPDRRHGQRL